MSTLGRYYDPATGQFLSVDPAIAVTGQSYAYAADNPVIGTDPSGLMCVIHNSHGGCLGSSFVNSAEQFAGCIATYCYETPRGAANLAAGAGNELLQALNAVQTLETGSNPGFGVSEPFPCGPASGAYQVGEIGALAVGGLVPGVDEGAAAAEVGTQAEVDLNLATEARTLHILQGDSTGGGHLWPGLAGKTPFPANWSSSRIMNAISDIATDPSAWKSAVPQGGRTFLSGTVDGVDIRVVVDTQSGEIVTGYPTNLPRNK